MFYEWPIVTETVKMCLLGHSNGSGVTKMDKEEAARSLQWFWID